MNDAFYDYSAAFVSVALRDYSEYSAVAVTGVRIECRPVLAEGSVASRFRPERRVPVLDVIDLERFQMKYFDEILSSACSLARNPRLALSEVEVIVDVTITSDSVLDAIWDDDSVDITPLVLTGERTSGYFDGTFGVPRRDVITALIMTAQRKLISIASGLELSDSLAAGLGELTLAHINDDQIDSLAISVALAAWRMADQHKPERGWADEDDEENGEYKGYDVANWGLK